MGWVKDYKTLIMAISTIMCIISVIASGLTKLFKLSETKILKKFAPDGVM
jgi:hypothetical protein